MARRSWASLSPSYRRRLERGNVSRQEYESGESLQTARGHRQREHVRRADNTARSGKAFHVVTPDGVVSLTSRYSRDRKLAAAYMGAVGRFTYDGDPSHLQEFRNRRVVGLRLETDPRVLRQLVLTGDLRIPFYESHGGAAA